MIRPSEWNMRQIREQQQQRAAANSNAGMSPRDAVVAARRDVSREMENDQNAAYDEITDDEGNPR